MATVHIKEERNLKKFTVIDLFAGCGGLSEGFIRQGFFPVAYVEIYSIIRVRNLRRN